MCFDNLETDPCEHDQIANEYITENGSRKHNEMKYDLHKIFSFSDAAQ